MHVAQSLAHLFRAPDVRAGAGVARSVLVAQPMTTKRGKTLAESFGWTASLAMDRVDERDTVLVCADEPLRSALSELARTHGYQAHVSATPLQAIEALQDSKLRVRHALISSTLPHDWGRGLHEFLADEYPDVRRVMLSA